MVTRRNFLRYSGVAATALVAAACGTVQTAPAAEEPAMEEKKEAPKEAAQEAPAKEVQKLSIHSYGNAAVLERYVRVLGVFNEQFAGEYEAEATITPFAEYNPKLLSQITAGVPPDVWNLWAQFKSNYVERGIVLDITDRVKASATASLDHYVQPMHEAMSYQGRIWGTAQDFNGTLIYLNLTIFQNAGLELPSEDWTMEDLRTIGKRLVNPEENIWGAKNLANNTGSDNFAVMWNYGQHFWVDDEQTKSLVNSPAAVAMYNIYQEMAYADRSIPSAANPQGQGLGSHQGYYATWDAWGNEPWWINFRNEGNVPFEWQAHTYPAGPMDQKHFSQGHLWSIAESHPDHDTAWFLAEWIGGIEGWKQWVALGQGQPLPVSDRALWEQYYSFLAPDKAQIQTDFMLERVYKGLAFNFQYWPTYGECSGIMREAHQSIFGESPGDVKSTLDDAANRMEAILEEYKNRS